MDHIGYFEDGSAPPLREGSGAERRSLTRRRVLIGAGATAATAALVPAYRAVGVSQAQSTTDIDISNFGLTFDYLMGAFLDKGLDLLTDPRDSEIVREIRSHIEATKALTIDNIAALGGTPVDPPAFSFPDELTADRDAFVTQAAAFAELGVSGYHGQITNIEAVEVLGAAAGVAGTKSRHAAILTALAGGDPLPTPVEATKTLEEVLEAAAPFRGEEQ